MTAVTFDTLKFVETLKASGFDDIQAKGMASAIREVQNSHLDDLATKRDVEDLKRERQELVTRGEVELLKREREELASKGDILRLERDIKEMDIRLDGKIETTKAELRRDIEASKVEIIKWVVGASGAIVALIKLLPGGH